MLVFDTETRTDTTQRLTFGGARYYIGKHCVEEFLFYADDLPVKDRCILEQYVSTHQASNPKLRLLSRKEFAKKLYRYGYQYRCLIVGFNLPFDLSRVAFNSTTARGRFAGGFSLGIWSYNRKGVEYQNPFRPRIGIKRIDSKRALKGFTARYQPDQIDLIPEGSLTGKPEEGHKYRGHFLDLRTLAFALTDIGYSLESACKAFAVEHRKQKARRHGIVSNAYIDYNRRDVLATSELAFKLLEEYAKHPVALQPTRAYSPASIGKAYLRAMGVKPIMERQPDFPKKYLGYATTAFYGGRASAHIRKVPVPVVYTDFLSMYPTVNSLVGLWDFVTARKIKVVDHCQREITAFLKRLTADSLFRPETWKRLAGFVKLIPDGAVLPTRGRYSAASNDWQVAINYLHSKGSDSKDGLWFSLPDVAASVILTGKVPKIMDAFCIKPVGKLKGLESTKLLGAIDINPSKQDFFRIVIEERKSLAARSLPEKDLERLDKALKVLANAASYGIYAEMNRQESEKKEKVTCYGIDPEAFPCRVAHPDNPGAYCFPPLASLITGAARLMLSLLEHCVDEMRGTYAMEDTDSMAIVASRRGGLIPCSGGAVRTREGQPAIKVLSWKQVDQIAHRFRSLNPYDRDSVPGSVLKIEDDNFDPKTGKQRQIYCLAISAKRYVLFSRDKRGIPVLLRKSVNNKTDHWSQHGLGHLLNPSDPDSEDREWIAQAWLNLLRKSHRLRERKAPFGQKPAVGRVAISSPAVLRPLAALNDGKEYPDQIKPFNFLLSCHVRAFGHPLGVDPERFHLIAPYEPHSMKWLNLDWFDQYSGEGYKVTAEGEHGTRTTARVKTYAETLLEYEFHPEAKCADASGNPSGKQTVGLLQRRHVQVDGIIYIGKESNSLEEVEEGLVHSAGNVYTEYTDPTEWECVILPRMKKVSLTILQRETGFSRRMLIDARTGKRRPHPKNQKLLAEIVRKLGFS